MNDPRMAFIIQARNGSLRLPRKITTPFFEGKNILEIVAEKVNSLGQQLNVKTIIATTTATSDDDIAAIADNAGVLCYRGSEHDVLKRFVDAAECFNVDRITRVCSDNPFLDIEGSRQIIDTSRIDEGCDYIGYEIDNVVSIKTHLGLWPEYVHLNALRRVQHSTTQKIYHEHVTNFIYEHPEQFKIKLLKAPLVAAHKNDIRLTIDTERDFKLLANVYQDIASLHAKPTVADIVAYLDNRPEILHEMRMLINSNPK